MLQQLVYVSRARDTLTSVLSVSDILDQARRNNGRDGITGALAFTAKHFVQLIEGESHALDRLLADLNIDPRHNDLRIVERIDVSGRAFGDWTMIAARFTPENTQALQRLLADAPADIAPYRQLLSAMIGEQHGALPQP